MQNVIKIFLSTFIFFFLTSFTKVKSPGLPIRDCTLTKAELTKLCSNMESRDTLPENHPSGYYYMYELTLAMMAGADPVKDSEEVIANKIGAFLIKNSKCLICDSANLKKENISMIKMNIALGTIDFVDRLIEIYKYDLLNDVVGSDNLSLLDFVYNEYVYYKRNDANSNRTKGLKKLYQIFRLKGAKHYKTVPIDKEIES